MLTLLCACELATCARGREAAAASPRVADASDAAVIDHAGTQWLVLELELARVKLELVGQAAGEPRTFEALRAYLAARGERLVMATNAGIFAEDRTPLGLFIEAAREVRPLAREDGVGNFYLKPNGVFWLDARGAHVAATERYAPEGTVSLATQSGPLLLEGGNVHPSFTAPGTSLKVRSAVGVDARGHVWIALSRGPVSFIDSATLFRDRLGCGDALYLDGEISGVLRPGGVDGIANHTYAGLIVASVR